jgi:hypothetical protein
MKQEHYLFMKDKQLYLAGMLSVDVEEKQDLIDDAIKAFNDILHNRFPWHVSAEDTQKQDAVQSFYDRYGDETDPRHKAMLAQWRKALKMAREKSKEAR